MYTRNKAFRQISKGGQANEDKLLPVLLDRLTDNAPEKKTEALDSNIMNADQLKRAVLRDLAWLLNTVNLESIKELDGLEYVKQSSINFGITPMAGQRMSEIDPHEIEEKVLQAILNFEPRLLPDDLEVTCVQETHDLEHYNVLFLIIKGMLWCNPYPVEFYVKTEIDLESGHIEMKEDGN
ncbi:hypothetical protein V757_11315 [Pelistega indica]|uniref:IraD/Gp25-like domain-containing protein n=1 Tax=Pelistega indica TaxID=1414851 RepID=V8FUE0_9BURK|nr:MULTISPECIES: type VI secretion system baseplate subunit TssE [Pelistega]ETD67476.1 hypothetical protein V757_11315 [Pelistega indica]